MLFIEKKSKKIEGVCFYRRCPFPQREIEMAAEKMEMFWEHLMPLTYAAFNENGRVAP